MKFTSVHRILLVTGFLVLGVPSSAVALEFHETHIFPFFKDIVFSEATIGFPAHRHYNVFDDFILDRGSSSFRAVASETFQQAFSDRRAQAGDSPSKHGFTTKEA